jgi:translation initiation factor IF-1
MYPCAVRRNRFRLKPGDKLKLETTVCQARKTLVSAR